MRGAEMSTTAVVVGSLYVHCPDALRDELPPLMDALYPGVWRSEFCSDGETIFGLSEVPYPVEQTRSTLANLYQWSHQRGLTVYWSWVPPAGAVVFPGGSLGLTCREGQASVMVRAELQSWFPGAYLYTFPAYEGWVLHEVDAPRPSEDLYVRYLSLQRQVPGVVLHWQPWFDQVMLPNGSLESVYHPGV